MSTNKTPDDTDSAASEIISTADNFLKKERETGWLRKFVFDDNLNVYVNKPKTESFAEVKQSQKADDLEKALNNH